jgi:hypothetical protein
LVIAPIAVLVIVGTTGAAVAQAAETPDQAADVHTLTEVRERLGRPDAFSILYYDEPGTDGSVQTVTMSQWTYFDEGLEFTFTDEVIVTEDTFELEPGVEAEPVPYDPDQFRAYMSPEEVLEATGLEEFFGGSADELVDGGELYFADRLIWGIKDGELRYIEAVALEAQAARGEGE